MEPEDRSTETDLYQNPDDTTAGETSPLTSDLMDDRSLLETCDLLLSDQQQYEYGEDLGITAVALYDYQAGEGPGSFFL